LKSAESKSKIYIVPTRRGFAYGLWTIALLITGAVTGNHALIGVLTLLITLGLLTMHLTHLNLARLQIKAVEVEPGFAGENGVLRMKVNNPLDTPMVSLQIGEQIEGNVLNVPAGERWLPNLNIALAKRGIHQIDSIKIASVYPLGLFYAWTNWEGEAVSIVYPSRDPEREIHPTQVLNDSQGLGSELEFDGHRNAIEGDSARRLDWKVYARSQKLLFKLYDRETEDPMILRWDSIPGSDVEEKLSALSTSIDACKRSRRPIGLVLPDQQFPVRSSEDHYVKCLEALAVFK
jgi:uncharacterized protein (DUF58 family)